MYLLQQPASLESLALDGLAVWITLQARELTSPASEPARLDALSRRVAAIRDLLHHNVPRTLHDALTSKTITQLYLLLEQTQTKAIARMIETLLTNRLTCLSLNIEQFKMFRDSLCSKSHMLTGLVHLDLSKDNLARYLCDYYKYTDALETDIIRLIQELQGLKNFTIKDFCTDNILRCIVKNCPMLEELNISSSFRLNRNSANILTQLSNLKSINLQCTPIRHAGIEAILLGCKNIENIVIPYTYHEASSISSVINQLVSKKHNVESFNLKTYKNDCSRLEGLETVFRMCPLIENLTVRSFRRQNNTIAIIGLNYLRSLTLKEYIFHEVKQALQVIGGNLERLFLVRIKYFDLNALIDISQMCPNLQDLSIKQCTFVSGPTTSSTKELEVAPFRNLIGLTLEMESSPQARATVQLEAAVFLLSNCLNIEYIEFTNAIMLTDNVMLSIMDKNPLHHLKLFKIAHYVRMPALSTLVLDRIIQNCTNCPEVIQSEFFDFTNIYHT